MKSVLAKSPEDIEFKGDARWDLVQRVIGSATFRNSARLRDFLLYVAACAIREAPEEATEQQIGIHVFQRHPGFNSTEDSIVRSQARLLRNKLTTYFQTEGLDETTLIEIPKGHYLPVFNSNTGTPATEDPSEIHPADALEIHSAPNAPAHSATPNPRFPSPAFPRHIAWIVSTLILLALVASFYLGRRSLISTGARTPVSRLWATFLSGDAPEVIYSNAIFVGTSNNGMRYANADGIEDPNQIVDHYTGIGEVSAVRAISRVFDQQHADFVLKRSRLVTWDEAKLHNLIFIGSIAENASLKVLPQGDDFVMVNNPGQSGFLNRHPKPGEPAQYMRPERPLTMDYALIALRPGVDPELRSFVFSGLTTMGTGAAVDYATSPQSAAELLRLVTGPNRQIRPFEALLEVQISGGVALRTRMVTIRVH